VLGRVGQPGFGTIEVPRPVANEGIPAGSAQIEPEQVDGGGVIEFRLQRIQGDEPVGDCRHRFEVSPPGLVQDRRGGRLRDIAVEQAPDEFPVPFLGLPGTGRGDRDDLARVIGRRDP
jgi:hypothetical protein